MQGHSRGPTGDRPARGDLRPRPGLTDDDPSAFAYELEAARLGMPWALERIHGSLARPVAAYLRSQGVDDPDGLANEVLLRVLTNLDRFEGDQRSFRSWAFTIAHHRLVDHRRHASRRLATALIETGAIEVVGGDAEADALERVDVDRVRALLSRLSPDQRDVLLLRVVADLAVEQVANALGKTPGAVKALQRRGIASLQRLLAEEAE